MDDRYKTVGSVEIRLMEEFSEVMSLLCKGVRFGWLNYHPDDKTKIPNIELIKREMDDVMKCWEEFIQGF